MVEGFSLGSYLLLVDDTGRLVRGGKVEIAEGAAEILQRLGSSVEGWQARVEKLGRGRMFGRFFAASRARLREVAERLGLRRLANLNACPTAWPGPKVGTLMRNKSPALSRLADME